MYLPAGRSTAWELAKTSDETVTFAKLFTKMLPPRPAPPPPPLPPAPPWASPFANVKFWIVMFPE